MKKLTYRILVLEGTLRKSWGVLEITHFSYTFFERATVRIFPPIVHTHANWNFSKVEHVNITHNQKFFTQTITECASLP